MWLGLGLRVSSVVVILFQAALLDWYLIEYSGDAYAIAWITADICVIIFVVCSYAYADKYFQQYAYESKAEKPPAAIVEVQPVLHDLTEEATGPLNLPHSNGKPGSRPLLPDHMISDMERNGGRVKLHSTHEAEKAEDERVNRLKTGSTRAKFKLGALPLAYLGWAFYATILSAKMLVIFILHGQKINTHALFGANMLELAFACTAVVFALVVSGHKKIAKNTNQKPVIRWMQNHVMLDMLDSVDILEILYEASSEEHIEVQKTVRSSILLFVCIQLLLPSVGLYQLSATNFAHKEPAGYWSVLQQFLSMLFGNIPFLCIRIYLFSKGKFTGSTFIFIIKNIYGIITNLWEFYHWWLNVRSSRQQAKIFVPVDCEDD